MTDTAIQDGTGGAKTTREDKMIEDSSRVESASSSNKAPRFPPAVLVRIAEHLVSQFAFKTTASLNRTSKIVHSGTLPVLYETFFYNDFQNLPRNRKGLAALPEAVKNHTKYIFYTTSGEKAKELDGLNQCPGVVMTVSVDFVGALKEPDVAHVRIYKPVSSATAYTIIETPFRQNSIGRGRMAHEMCTAGQHLMSLMQLTGLLGGGDPAQMPFTDIAMAPDCIEVSKKRLVRPVTNIRKVILVEGAHLHAHPPARLSTVKSNLRLHNTEVEVNGEGVTFGDLTATYMELIKLAGMQRDAKNMFDAEQKLIPEHGFGNLSFGTSTCMLRLGYAEWHLNLVMTMTETEDFVRKLKVEADAQPTILLNRLHITIYQDSVVEYDEMTSLLKSIHKIYATHITGKHHILPTRSDPPELIRCIAMSKMALSPALAKEIGWMSTSRRSVYPLVATQLTGSIKVVSKKRGVNVLVEIDKNQKFPDGPPKAFASIMKLIA